MLQKSFQHAVVHLEDLEGLPRAGPLPWWTVAMGKGARKHGKGHGQLKANHQAEVSFWAWTHVSVLMVMSSIRQRCGSWMGESGGMVCGRSQTLVFC